MLTRVLGKYLPHIGPAMQKAWILQFQSGFTIYITERQIYSAETWHERQGISLNWQLHSCSTAWTQSMEENNTALFALLIPCGESIGDQWNPHTKGQQCEKRSTLWWRQQMETFSASLAISAENLPVSVNSPHKGQWRTTSMFSLICAQINSWVNNREVGDLRRHRAHYDVLVMSRITCLQVCHQHYGMTKYTQQWQHVGNLEFHLTGNFIVCQRAHTKQMKQKY